MRLAHTLVVALGVLISCSPAAPTVVEPTAAPEVTTAPPTPSASAPPAPSLIVPAEIRAIVDAADRLPEDRALDAGRKPAEMLTFFGVKPGMRVAELGSGGGYTSELLARAVGPTGAVYGQNTKFILDRFAEKPWSARLTRPVMKNTVRIDREFDDPLPKDVKNLDGVFVVLFYHDLYWMKVDRAAMNKVVFDALAPGGMYGIIDHSAKPGAGSNDTESLHRIEESTLREDVQKAGFVLEKEGDFLRNPKDPRDWSTSPGAAGDQRGTSDRFVLLFRKPR